MKTVMGLCGNERVPINNQVVVYDALHTVILHPPTMRFRSEREYGEVGLALGVVQIHTVEVLNVM
jgi:hypothetical protein